MQFTRKPVFVRRWDDDDAPQIGYRQAGALKTVLKAALVTGYGSKQGLGWEVLHEDSATDRIALRSADASSTQSVLYIDNGNTRNYTAKVCAYESMSDIDKGDGIFKYYDSDRKNLFISTAVRSGENAEWIVVGHDTAFVLIINAYDNTDAAILLFGDVPSYKVGDNFNAILFADFNMRDSTSLSNTGMPQSIQNAAITLSRAADMQSKDVNLSGTNIPGGFTGQYPDPISGGWCCEPVLFAESINSKEGYRCIAPGVFASYNFTNRDAFDFGETLPHTDTDRFIWVKLPGNRSKACIVVNTVEWVAP